MGNLSCVSCRHGRRCVYTIDRSNSAALQPQAPAPADAPVDVRPATAIGDVAPKVIVHRPAQFVEEGAESSEKSAPSDTELPVIVAHETAADISTVEMVAVDCEPRGRTVTIPEAGHCFRRIRVSPSEDEAIAKVMERGSVVRRSTRKTDPKGQMRPKIISFKEESLKRKKKKDIHKTVTPPSTPEPTRAETPIGSADEHRTSITSKEDTTTTTTPTTTPTKAPRVNVEDVDDEVVIPAEVTASLLEHLPPSTVDLEPPPPRRGRVSVSWDSNPCKVISSSSGER